MLTRRSFVSLSALALLGAAVPACLHGCGTIASADASEASDADKPEKLSAFAFDTVVTIEAYGAGEALSQVEERLQYFERIFSRTLEGSDVYAINHADGMPVEVHGETAELLAAALRYSELSDGLFDPTIGSVSALWDFKNGVVPDDAALNDALEHVDFRTVGLDERTVTLTDPLAKLDLGGIAKGYIADDIVGFLRDNGCRSALVNLGGNTYALGTKPDGSAWRVGLQDPNQARGTLFATTSVADRSVVASGINERSFLRDGVLYHHLLDPRTGMPARTGTASATIVSERSLDGDALSTIAFLMGPDDGPGFVQQQGDMQVVYVRTDGTVTSTDGLEIEAL